MASSPGIVLRRGAIPTSRARLGAAAPFAPKVGAPPQFLNVPAHLSFWGNETDGDCVTAEEAFAKGCGQPAVFITDAVAVGWASTHGVLNGAIILDVLTWMETDGFQQENETYNNGKPLAVDWTNASALRSAISNGPVKIGIAADQIEGAWRAVDGATGWVATGFQQDGNEDHCVSLCGYGSFAWLAGQLGSQLPGGIDPNALGYALFSWNSIGIIDDASMRAITHEAWFRNPTTVQST